MIQYKQSLNTFKRAVLFGDILIVLVRLISQVGISLQLLLSIAQLVITSFIYRRIQSTTEAKFSILVNLVLIYLLVINMIYWHTKGEYREQSILFQTLINEYKNWGYIFEGLFRGFSLLISWRFHQFSSFMETNNIQQEVEIV